MAEETPEPMPGIADISDLLDRYRDLASATQNPMCVWAALQLISWDRQQRWAMDEPVSLPAWIANYLSESAEGIMELSAGLDPREPPSEPSFTPSSPEQAIAHPDFKADVKRRSIDPVKAMGLVPQALRLRLDSGRNMFKEYESKMSKVQETHAYDALIESGKSSQDAVRKVTEIFGGNRSDRSQYDRIAEGRQIIEQLKKPGG